MVSWDLGRLHPRKTMSFFESAERPRELADFAQDGELADFAPRWELADFVLSSELVDFARKRELAYFAPRDDCHLELIRWMKNH
jgi:hypothetical protein